MQLIIEPLIPSVNHDHYQVCSSTYIDSILFISRLLILRTRYDPKQQTLTGAHLRNGDRTFPVQAVFSHSLALLSPLSLSFCLPVTDRSPSPSIELAR